MGGSLSLLLCAALLMVAVASELADETQNPLGFRRSLQQRRTIPDERIFGGEDAAIGEFPYYVSLKSFGVHLCGGALISPNVVLTAAHCLQSVSMRHPTVEVGMVNIDGTQESGEVVESFDTCTSIVHDRFDPLELFDGHDIALLILNGVSRATPAELPVNLPLGPGTETSVVGFGRLNNTQPAVKLQKSDKFVVMANEECAKKFRRDLGSNLLCSGDPSGSDVCKGDSGGPIVTRDKKTVVGLVSFGAKDCTDEDFPSVFTRVSEFFDFIARFGEGESSRFDKDGCSAGDPLLPAGLSSLGNEVPPSPPPPPPPTTTTPTTTRSPLPSSPPPVGPTAEGIAEAINNGDTETAASLIEDAVEQDNIDAIVEAMKLAVASGNRSEAANALFTAIRNGVSTAKLLPAIAVLRDGK